MNSRIILVTLALTLASACGPFLGPATSTPIPATIPPLARISLDAILIQPGDLPPEFAAGNLTRAASANLGSLPDAQNAIRQEFIADGFFRSDGVTVLLYESASNLETAYETTRRALGTDQQPLSGVGEQATIATEENLGYVSTKIAFVRCQALVYVHLFSNAEPQVAILYAQRLDSRLEALVCEQDD